MNKIIFKKEHGFTGVLNVLAISLIMYGGVYFLLNNYILSFVITVIIVCVLLMVLNKKWFKTGWCMFWCT